MAVIDTGAQSLQISSQTDDTFIELDFTYSINGVDFEESSNVTLTTKAYGPTTAVVTLNSEDSTDNDNNDAVATILILSSNADTSATRSKATASTATVHAKTYYSTSPNSGDEHYFTFRAPSSGINNVWNLVKYNYESTSWIDYASVVLWMPTPLGGYIAVSVDVDYNYGGLPNPTPGWENAALTMSTTYTYWGSFPTGWLSVSWDDAKLSGCTATVTRVIN